MLPICLMNVDWPLTDDDDYIDAVLSDSLGFPGIQKELQEAALHLEIQALND